MQEVTITRQHEEMITMLIMGENISDIAKKLSVQRQTIYNWLGRDDVKVEIDRRRAELSRQGNEFIRKDLLTYINNIKELANDKSDKRVCLAANQYLINRIYGNPSSQATSEDKEDNEVTSNVDLENEIAKFKMKKQA
jgi:transposase-like protein